MSIRAFLLALAAAALLAACSTPPPTAAPSPTGPAEEAVTTPIPVLAGGYRPLQVGDKVETATIGYQYILPSFDKPVVDIAFGRYLLELITVKPELVNGLVSYLQEIASQPHDILAFDENDPKQADPKPMHIDPNKPIEIVYIPIGDEPHFWSVRETQQGEMRAGYKLVRRKDGGLRVINGYDQVTMHSMTFNTVNGLGSGLVFSSRLALLKTILNERHYQVGTDVISSYPPPLTAYDPRVLKTDPSKQGLEQDVDWVLIARPGPNPGIYSP